MWSATGSGGSLLSSVEHGVGTIGFTTMVVQFALAQRSLISHGLRMLVFEEYRLDTLGFNSRLCLNAHHLSVHYLPKRLLLCGMASDGIFFQTEPHLPSPLQRAGHMSPSELTPILIAIPSNSLFSFQFGALLRRRDTWRARSNHFTRFSCAASSGIH